MKRKLYTLVTPFLIILLIIIFTEVVFRIAWDGKREVPAEPSRYPYSPDPNPKISYLLKPDYTYEYGKIRTNKYGFRIDNSIKEQKPSGVYRVAVLGDSVIFGTGARFYKTTPYIIQKRLNALNINNINRFEVLNFAIPGHNILQYIEVLKTYAIRYKPDFVVLGITIYNDLDGRSISYLGKGYLQDYIVTEVHGIGYEASPPSRLINLSYIYRYLTYKHEGIDRAKKQSIEKHAKLEKSLPASCDENDPIWKDLDLYFDDLKTISQKEGFNILVLIFPTTEQVYFEDLSRKPQELITKQLINRSIPYIDLYDDFRSVYKVSGVLPMRDIKSHPDDIMYNLAGSRVRDWLAEKILPRTGNIYKSDIPIGDKGDVQYLSFGWGEREKLGASGYRWMLGSRGRLVFNDFHKTISSLEISGFPFEGCGAQTVQIYINDEPAGTVIMDKVGMLSSYRLKFDKPVILRKYNFLDFVVNCAKPSPGDAESNVITRRLLSIGVSGVSLH